MTAILRSAAAVACAGLLALAASAQAATDAGKQVTVSGKLACAMCILKQKEAKTCKNVLVTTEGGKEVTYALADNAVTKAYVMQACEKTLPVKVTGTLAEEAGKKTITASKIDKS
jgi:D-arabinose 1-dehydrogenase-like Zn-dependent alcohol dehydrogenase